MDHKTDAEIVVRVLNGDVQAFALLVEAYKRPVFNLAFRMTGSYSDADDLTQETFIRAYQKLYQFDREKKIFTWLYTIGINLIRNHLKKKVWDLSPQTKDRFIQESQLQEHENGDPDLLSEDSLNRLEKNMQRLPVDLREAMILRFHHDLTFEEIAVITGGSPGAVKMRIYRGLEKLKMLMDKKDNL